MRTLATIAAVVLTTLPSPARAAEPAPPDTLRVLVWNIQRGSNNFGQDGPEKALAVIREVGPDVCLLQESYDINGDRPHLGAWLADQLGWNQFQGDSPHLCILTPFEIEDPFIQAPWHLVGATLTDDAGRRFRACSIWIDWRACTPYALRDNPDTTDEDLLLNETERSSRLEQARAILDYLDRQGHTAGDLPLLVGGDWNCPSHLDWTPAAAAVYRHRRALPLPVSTAVTDAGFVDAFRAVHPDPITRPGHTWTPIIEGTESGPVLSTMDRIDRLYVRDRDLPRLRPVRAFTLPRVYEPAGTPLPERTFPSDHSAVVIDFEWAEGDGPTADAGIARPAFLPGPFELAWHDEFEGEELDPAKWKPWAPGPRRDAWNIEDAAALTGDGRLVITTSMGTDDEGNARVESGGVWTQALFEPRYGYIEARMKMHDAPGLWSAFWLNVGGMGNPVGNPAEAGVEIDVIESISIPRDRDRAMFTIHWDGYAEHHRKAHHNTRIPGMHEEFKTYGVWWSPNELRFYVDGEEHWRTSAAVPRIPQYMILSCEVGSWAGKIDPEQLPATTEVDWVRVWQHPKSQSMEPGERADGTGR